MKPMLIFAAAAVWLSVSAIARAQVSSSAGTQPPPQVSAQTSTQVNSPTNAVSTMTGAIVPSGQGATGARGGSSSTVAPVAAACSFGVSLRADLTAFGCASDPLSAPTYQIPAEAGATAVTTGPVDGFGAKAQTVTPNTTSSAGSTGGVSSSARCLGAIPSMAGNTSATNLFGGTGAC